MGKITLDFSRVANFVQTIQKTPADTGGQYLEIDMIMNGKTSGTPAHYHPFSEERFRVDEGDIEILAKGQWRRVYKRETVVVPPNEIHAWRKTFDTKAVVNILVISPSDFPEYMLTMAALCESGTVEATKNLKFLIYHAMVQKRYPVSTKFTGLMANLFTDLLAGVGRMRGYTLPAPVAYDRA